ncbi:MAG TPA: sugar ABC transporter ATP-binding protein [Spirochaetia bacterium]|nr:sugar ABC transporter ATP-binding protein [Spirochaetia bacterium]HRZ63482.1 sugar ABC transporter ATP-binding protein [Spirochaetia bacterium]
MDQARPMLSLRGVGKQYNGTRVLEGVSFDVMPGQIVGLVGENGAGKTTLMRILFGMGVIAETGGYEGSVLLDGREVRFKSPFDALAAGIGMVHQEFSLIPGFTATENILLNRESTRPNILVDLFGDRMSVLDRATMGLRSRKAIERLGVPLDPDTQVREMPVGHKQFTEIARELDREQVRLLVLDEPSAVLAESEAETLLAAMRKLAEQGIAIVFISHRLREVLEVADKVVVLRDGRLVKEAENESLSLRDLASLMVGRSFEGSSEARRPAERPSGAGFLEVEGLWVDMPGETVRDLSFSVAEGEIFGIGGLAGQGKLGVPNGVMGLFAAGGSVRLGGEAVPLNAPRRALEAGMAFVSEDRRGVGLLLDEGIDWNVCFSAMQLRDLAVRPLLGGLFKWRSDSAMRAVAEEYVRALDIKCTSVRQRAGNLSGGNQQKVCLAKAFALEPRLLFVSEPTRGIDVGAKRLVLDEIRRVNRERGTTIVMVSSELEELRLICDRIAIVDEGRLAGILAPEAPVEEFGLLMSGLGGRAAAPGAPAAPGRP